MPEETRNVAQSVGLVSMDGVIVVGKSFFEVLGPHTIELAESLANQPVELRIRSLLRATLHNHVAELDLVKGDDERRS